MLKDIIRLIIKLNITLEKPDKNNKLASYKIINKLNLNSK